jgi:hypothetical protein
VGPASYVLGRLHRVAIVSDKRVTEIQIHSAAASLHDPKVAFCSGVCPTIQEWIHCQLAKAAGLTSKKRQVPIGE